jgi:putative transposase/transposase-like zinc-binding protein
MAGVPCKGTARPHWEVADVFRLYGEDYRRSRALPSSHLRIMRAVELCRTSALGGHLERCDSCGFSRPAYNSCRNRHCPKCQALAKARWLKAREEELLPVPYFHLVFTLPHELNPIALCNKAAVFDILFRAVSQTLLEFGADNERGLGGTLGVTAILHTWDQTLRDHIHLHCAIAGGALSQDGQRWTSARPDFLFPVRALSQVFRGKFLDFLKKDFQDGKLIFPGQTAELASAPAFRCLLAQLYDKKWVVYSKRAFSGPQSVLDYIGRYTHRIAISNHRLLSVEDSTVTFSYRDRRDANQRKTMSLAADEFIRRFLLHAIPTSFMRVRHFGLLANRRKKTALSRCRELLGLHPHIQRSNEKTTDELVLDLTGKDLRACPSCRAGRMQIVGDIASLWAVAIHPPRLDSS